jgi:hypothetical protein
MILLPAFVGALLLWQAILGLRKAPIPQTPSRSFIQWALISAMGVAGLACILLTVVALLSLGI